MKFLNEYRDPKRARRLIDHIKATVTRPWTIMEICGGQTHAILRYGIDQVLPDEITLIHGPGCPVCVTPLELIDRAIAIAMQPDVTFCSFGDMLRIPGSEKDLFLAKSEGADVRVVYSTIEALQLARDLPDRKVVFFGVGFETTAPSTAMAVHQAHLQKFSNFYLLASHVLVPPAMIALLESPENLVQGYLAAGHVCAIQGGSEYEPIAKKYHVPIVITGFEPIDILTGIAAVVSQLEQGKARVENQYARVVKTDGNPHARSVVDQVFEVCDRKWRGIGDIPSSGLKIRPKYQNHDAELVFNVGDISVQEPENCISGLILQGLKKPYECESFGTTCTPVKPLGATMVSSEGACAAYYSYSRFKNKEINKSHKS